MTSFDKRPGRRIMVGSTLWKWQCGRSDVVAYSEHGQKLMSKPWLLKCVSLEMWERGHRKGTQDGMLTPGEVASWIAISNLKQT